MICSKANHLNGHSGMLPHSCNLHSWVQDTLKSELMKELSSYILENYISDEAYAMLSAVEARIANHEDNRIMGEAMEFVVQKVRSMASAKMYEPGRVLPLSAPPKRFYRLFWRSITRRLVETVTHMDQ